MHLQVGAHGALSGPQQFAPVGKLPRAPLAQEDGGREGGRGRRREREREERERERERDRNRQRATGTDIES